MEKLRHLFSSGVSVERRVLHVSNHMMHSVKIEMLTATICIPSRLAKRRRLFGSGVPGLALRKQRFQHVSNHMRHQMAIGMLTTTICNPCLLAKSRFPRSNGTFQRLVQQPQQPDGINLPLEIQNSEPTIVLKW